MKKEIIALMKNKNYKFIKKIKKIDDIELFVIPIEDESLHVYIPIAPNNYMLSMETATLSYAIQVQSVRYDCEEGEYFSSNDYELNRMDITIHSYAELCQYLHTLYRYNYVNKTVTLTDVDVYTEISLTEFSVTLFDKDKDILFTYSISEKKNRGIDLLTTLGKLETIYTEYALCRDSIELSNNKWKFTSNVKEGNSYGIWLECSHSIKFFSSSDIIKYRPIIKALHVGVIFYDSSLINLMPTKDAAFLPGQFDLDADTAEFVIRQYIDDAFYFEAIIEVITYTKHITMLTKLILDIQISGSVQNLQDRTVCEICYLIEHHTLRTTGRRVFGDDYGLSIIIDTELTYNLSELPSIYDILEEIYQDYTNKEMEEY